METFNLPLTGAFEAKTIEIADKFQQADPGTQFKLCLFDSGTVTADAVLAFHEIVRTRPRGIGLHIHSHISLQGSEVLVWLAGDTRSLRSDAWIHFREYPKNRLGRSDFQQFQDSLEGYETTPGLTVFQENYLQIERHVKKHLPAHLLNRRIWGGELAEWHILKPFAVKAETPRIETPTPKTRAPRPAAKPEVVPYTPRLL